MMRLITLLELADSVPTADFGIRFFSSCGGRGMFRAKLQNSINLMASERDTSCFNLHYSPQNNILTILLQILITQISTIALMGVHTSKGGPKKRQLVSKK